MASGEQRQTIKCRGAVCWGPEEPLTVEEIEVAPPRASEVRFRVLFASLCHTDVQRRHGLPTPLYPRVLGHEGVGVVESVGEGVEGFEEGDMVIPSFLGECGECANCASAETNVCLRYRPTFHGLMPDMSSRMSARGQRLYHLFSCATFAEYAVANCNYLVKVCPRLPAAHASLLSCGFTTGFGAAWREAKVEKGSSVAVFGLGGVGIGAIVGAKMQGASKIIGVDLNEGKKEKAKMYGMTHFINPKEATNNKKAVVETVKEMTDGLGVNYSFECTGAAGPVVSGAIESTLVGRGVTVMFGGGGLERNVSINRTELLQGRTLKGSIFGGVKPRSHLPAIFVKCSDKEIHLDEMLTHEVDLDDINRAFELIKDADCLKVGIKISKM